MFRSRTFWIVVFPMLGVLALFTWATVIVVTRYGFDWRVVAATLIVLAVTVACSLPVLLIGSTLARHHMESGESTVNDGNRSPQEWLDVIDAIASHLPLDFRYDDPEEGLAYVRAGNVAQRMVRDARGSDTSYFAKVFDGLERLLDAPAPEIRELLVVGFIESLQNVSLNSDVALDVWEQWLGQRTKDGWDVIIDLWDGKLDGSRLSSYIETGVPV